MYVYILQYSWLLRGTESCQNINIHLDIVVVIAQFYHRLWNKAPFQETIMHTTTVLLNAAVKPLIEEKVKIQCEEIIPAQLDHHKG